GRIYSLDDKGAVLAEAVFIYRAEDKISIESTYVAAELRGQGIAGEMMAALMEHLKEKGLKATATCSYANSWLEQNKGLYPDIISDDLKSENVACKINIRR
ncbi:MAG TPA: GNAT family N-acetyltransferase, partial [Clostridia bacterium]|nr:GNAT family N-acetyltransferase [Clostridia bacterium]